MKQHFNYILMDVLAFVNRFPTEKTGKKEIQNLLGKLHPIITDKELVRLGPKGDGGYLIPNDLADIRACFSPGVSTVSGFEMDCAKLGMKIFLADKSVDRPAEEHELFYFIKKHIGAISNDDFLTIDKWVATSFPETESDLLLQMDVEGYEYEIILSISEALMRRFRIIVVEFHQLDMLWSKPFFRLADHTFNKILFTHSCVHIHPNNRLGSLKKEGLEIPKLMEFTFIRNDRIDSSKYQNEFPNPLDFDNTTNPSFSLPRCWYGKE
jgi:hypothetical protein